MNLIIRDNKGRFQKGSRINLGRTSLKKNGINKICPVCKKMFYTALWNIHKKTCSIGCATVLRKGKPSWNKGAKGKGICKATNGSFKEGHKSWMKGRQHSEESKRKMSESLKGLMVGEKHPLWKGGIDFRKPNEHKHLCSRYRAWMFAVKIRDGFKCKISNIDCNGRIEAHHILGWRDYPELRYQVNNGITLCHAHHPRKRAEEKRLQAEFQTLVASVSTISI